MSQDHQFAVAPDRCRKQICCVAKAAGNRWRWRLCDWPMTYGSRALGTRLRATFRSSAEHFPISRPQAMPMRFSTSMSSWISNMLSKLNKYSNLQGREQEERMKTWTQASPCMFWPSPGGAASIEQTQGWENAPPPSWWVTTYSAADSSLETVTPCCCYTSTTGGIAFFESVQFNRRTIGSQDVMAVQLGVKGASYLSLEMLQSMTVFLLVLTMMKGRWMMELGGGGLFACCSVCLFRCTRFLNAICWETRLNNCWNAMT